MSLSLDFREKLPLVASPWNVEERNIQIRDELNKALLEFHPV